MNEQTNDNLAARVEKLERENRRLKRVGLLVLAVVGGVVLMAQATTSPPVSDVTRTRRLEVLDEAGTSRAVLAPTASGGAFVMYDSNGKVQVTLASGGRGPGLRLDDEAGLTRFVVGVYGDEVLMALRNKNGKAIWEIRR